MITIKEIAWLAGLLEGEGWFGNWTRCKGQPVIQLSMTDKDVVQKAADIFQRTMHGPTKRYLNGHRVKDQFKTGVAGTHAAAIMMTIFPFMGERRRARIKQLLTQWKAYIPQRAANGGWLPAVCHPLKRDTGNGFCQNCYMRNYRKFGACRNNPNWPNLRNPRVFIPTT